MKRRSHVDWFVFTAGEDVLWPQWHQWRKDRFDFGILKPRKSEEVIGISRTDFRRVCDYKYLNAGEVLQALFMLSMLGVRDAVLYGDRFKFKCRWELKFGSCFIIEASRIDREQVRKGLKRKTDMNE
ncbi:MAG: hypothetical protein A4E65_00058 [Syntrophorhabdus sp. PtaU1.Bin153]|nr:MAG: hypothetical protein A4E65_00058 [Syntrophorhabdus sp. PtaU1.Bin153]